MADLPIMPVMTDALESDTASLSHERYGQYVRLLVRWWRDGCKPASLAYLSEISGVEESDLQKLTRFLTETADGWVQKKLFHTFHQQSRKRDEAKVAVLIRWHKEGKHKEKVADGCPLCTPEHTDACTEDDTTVSPAEDTEPPPPHIPSMNHEPSSLSKDKQKTALAEDFWKAFPHPPNRGSKSKVLEKLAKLPLPEQEAALASLTAHKAAIAETRKRNKDFQPCMAETFVNGRRWEGLEAIEPPEIVARETVWPDDPEEAEKAQALQRRVGKRSYASYFQKAPPRKNCEGWVVYAQNNFAVDRIDNQCGQALNEVYGRMNWRIEVAE